MKAADVMKHRVVTIGPDATIAEAARLMVHQGISGLPVLDRSGALVGMVTEGDLLRRAETGTERRRPHWLELILGPGRLADEYVRTHGRKIDEVMTRKVITIAPATPLEEVVGLMEKHHIKRLPVIDHGKLAGIVSRASLLTVLAHLAPMAPSTTLRDADIRKRVLAEIEQGKWAAAGSIDVIVSNGTVELRGVIGDERERQALHVAAENVAGVKKVVDHLVWIEPLSGMVIDVPSDASRPQTARRVGL